MSANTATHGGRGRLAEDASLPPPPPPLRIPSVPPLIHHRSSGSSSATALLSPPDREELLSPPEPGLSLPPHHSQHQSFKMGKMSSVAEIGGYYPSPASAHRHSFPQDNDTPHLGSSSSSSSSFAQPWQPSPALSSWSSSSSSTSSFGSAVPVRRASSPPRQRNAGASHSRVSEIPYPPTARYNDSRGMVDAMREVNLMGASMSTSPPTQHASYGTRAATDSSDTSSSATMRRASGGPASGGSGGVGGRNMMTKHQSTLLHQLWEETYFPTTDQRAEVARAADLSARQVQVWFQNQRQKQRRLLHSPADGTADTGTGASTSDAEDLSAGVNTAADYRKDLSLDGRAMKANRAAPDETKYRRLWAAPAPPPTKSSSPTGLSRSHSLGEVDHRYAGGPRRSGTMSTTTSPRARGADMQSTATAPYTKRPLEYSQHSHEDVDMDLQESMKLPRLEVKPNVNTSGIRLPRLAELDLPQAPGLPPPAHRHAYARSPDLGPFSL